MNKDKIRSILSTYEKKREYHESMLEERINAVNAKIPEIQKIDDEISKIGLRLTKAVLLNPSSRDEIVLKSKDEINELKLRKDTLLKANGVPYGYLELQHDCPNCKDTGFLPSGQKCKCFKQQIINEAYKMSNLNKVLSKENFANFNFDLFSSEKPEGANISPRENMLNIFSICEKFVLDFDKENDENLLFYGSTGLGKTYTQRTLSRILDKFRLIKFIGNDLRWERFK